MRAHNGLIGLALVLLVATWLRVPFITAGVPFFGSEDEARHFQRTVQMVKTGSFNPEYFNKPSFHFYLRMPVVAAAFDSAVKAGDIRRVDQMVTRSTAPRGGCHNCAGRAVWRWPTSRGRWQHHMFTRPSPGRGRRGRVPAAAIRHAGGSLILRVQEVHALREDRADQGPARAGLIVRSVQLR